MCQHFLAMRVGAAILAVLLTAFPIAVACADIVATGDVEPELPWTSKTNAYIGNTTEGSILVDDGSLLRSSNGYIGYEVSGVGAATVTGAGSRWISTRAIYVGHDGSGTLLIEAGGRVQTADYYSTYPSYLGYSSGSAGTTVVTGADSRWSNSSPLYVGLEGNGVLLIEAGGFVSNTSGYLGYALNSTGTATVTGAGSKWTNSKELYVGLQGSATLTVADGGEVAAQTLFAPLDRLHGNGTITASGAVLDADLCFDSTNPAEVTLTFGAGGTLIVKAAGGDLGAGYQGNGSLTIKEGAAVNSAYGYVAYGPGSSGMATVTGSGSSWTTSGEFYVGRDGDGTLSIEAGGQLVTGTASVRASYLGYSPNSSGTVKVSGSGSIWTCVYILYVGYSGDGSIWIEAAGQVISTWGRVGNGPSSTGSAIITGSGSKWTINNQLIVGSSGDGLLRVEDGGQIRVGDIRPYDPVSVGYASGSTGAVTITGPESKWRSGNSIYVGRQGAGTFRIEAGGSVESGEYHAAGSSCVGYLPGSTGTVTITGDGSTWKNWQGFVIGDSGTGTLLIEAGGRASSTSGILGSSSGSFGIATITGTGSTWSNSAKLYVGDSGSGTLRVEAGGQVSSMTGRLGNSSGSTGAATVTGNGSRWVNSSELYIGRYGAGTLLVQAGGEVSNSSGYVGYYAGSTGAVTVVGPGSKWMNNGALDIGRYGAGTLTVADGGEVTAEMLYASLDDLLGNGTITVTKGAMLDADLRFDAAHAGKAVVSFGSGGILTVSAAGGDLAAGYRSVGSLVVADGIVINAKKGYLGYEAGSVGAATVTGNGSTWANSSELYIGRYGAGTLRVEAGGQLSNSSYGYLGYASGSTGAVTVSGSGSKWTTHGILYVGQSGIGAILVEGGGWVNCPYSGYLGYSAGSSGTVTISGPGSKWTSSSTLLVGNSGTGTFRVEAGGLVTCADSYVGYNVGSTGTITVTGADSTWTPSGLLFVGRSGCGTLLVDRGGQVSGYRSYLGFASGSSGTAIVIGPGSTWTNSSTLYVGSSGSGTLYILDGGAVTASSVSINSNSLLAIDVGLDSKLTVGSDGTGTITNNGTVRILAGAGPEAGTQYAPIAAGAWSGTGTYQAVGGTWSSTTRSFSVSNVHQGASGTPVAISSLLALQRVRIHDDATDWTLGASFLARSGAMNFTATAADGQTLVDLENLLDPDQIVRGAWKFTASGTGYSASDPVYLSFHVGEGFVWSELNVWRLDGAGWSSFAAADLNYDGLYASFTVSALHGTGYAISAVPEPSTLVLFAVGAIGMAILAVRRNRPKPSCWPSV